MELHDLATGPVSPTVALIFATLGSLLGVLLVTQARRRTGLRRVRLVIYATLAVALPAVWLPALIVALALRVDGSVLRLNLEPLGTSLGVATGATMLALLPVCSGRPGALRQVLAGLCLASAIGGTGAFVATALTTGAPIVANPTWVGVAAAIACVTAVGLAGALAATRSLRLALGRATLVGSGLAVLYHVAAAALRVQPGPAGPIPADDVPGLVPQRIGLPCVITVAALLALIWYFAIGPATLRDVRLMFEPGSQTEQIEPWMIEQVQTRVALSSTAYAPVPGWPEVWARSEPTVAVHAVQIWGGIADAFARPWPGRPRQDPVPIESAPAGSSDAVPTAPATAQTTGMESAGTESTGPQWAGTESTGPESAGIAWREVPAWGLPTRQWSRAEVDDALGDGPTGRDWPSPGRNEAGVARRVRPAAANSRYGPLSGPGARPVSPAPDMSPADPDWIARLRAAASRAAATPATGHGSGVVIVQEYEAAPPLPRRNARPISRP